MLNKIARYWKEALGLVLLAVVVFLPEKFLVYNLDTAFMLVKAVGALLLARIAKSAYDSWQSRPVGSKKVSISRFMAETDNDLAKGLVHASQLLAIAIILAAALRG